MWFPMLADESKTAEVIATCGGPVASLRQVNHHLGLGHQMTVPG